MLALGTPDYSQPILLHNGRHSTVYRATRTRDGMPVVLKTSTSEPPSRQQANALRREFEIGQRIKHQNVVSYLELVHHALGVTIVEEDFGGLPLAQKRAGQALSPTEVLAIALASTRGLSAIHAAGFIHKDLSPSNILIHPEDGTVKLIDLGQASELREEIPQAGTPTTLEGSLRYISPEQTGRMNRKVNDRSDLYSLGAILYELLAGRPPFEADDPLGLVYDHIARAPKPLHEVRPEVPAALCQIVMKLLAKNAEDRYPGADALLEVLKRCTVGSAGTLSGDGAPSTPNTLDVPQTLYGRQNQRKHLLESFEEMCTNDGSSLMVLVSGYSGIGKSSLVQEVHKPLVRERGRFISGKFDQLRRDVPYAPLLQAFHGLVQQLLGEDDETLSHWRDRLLSALGESGQVVIEVIPDVQAIIGAQPPAPVLGAVENRNRFQRVFTRFARTFATHDHPLVIFLDDLQWADLPTLELLRHITGDPDCRHLLLIGAYRDNEVEAGHPLLRTIHEIERNIPVVQLVLQPLSLEHTSQLLADTLRCEHERVIGLARLLHDRTRGNPFFLKALLSSLWEDGAFSFCREAQAWQWKADALRTLDYTDNVVDLMIRRLRALPEETQALLSLAACFGNRFPIRTLARVGNKDSAHVFRQMLPALRSGLVLPLDAEYRWVEYLGETEQTAHFRFGHDRVQQAAYAMIDRETQPRLHLRIGRLLLKSATEAELEDDLFEIVGHYNAGSVLLHEPSERQHLAELNLRAARKAKLSSAYASALALVQAGDALLPRNRWSQVYELALCYQVERGELEYLTAHWDDAIHSLDVALAHVRSMPERCRIQAYRAMLFRMKNDLRGALDVGLEALRELGIDLPSEPTPEDVATGVGRAATLVDGLDIEGLYDLPDIRDPLQVHAMALLRECFAPAYFLGSPLVVLIGLRMTELTIEHGNSEHAGVGFVFFSSITLANSLQDYDTAYRFGQLALRLTEERYRKAQVHEALIRDMWGTFVCHYKEPVESARAELLRGFESGVEHGSYQWAGYCAIIHLFMSFWGACDLDEVEATLDFITPALRKVDPNNVQFYHAVRATVQNLRVACSTPCELADRHWPEKEAVLARGREQNDILTPFIVLMCRLSLANIFGDRRLALAIARESEPLAANLPGWYLAPVYQFHSALACAAAHADAPAQERGALRDTVAAAAEQHRKWACHAPTTYGHQASLLRAELAQLDGDLAVAMEGYDDAIDSARENRFLLNEALACERAAAFYRARARARLAAPYEQAAQAAYQRWGAWARLAQAPTSEPASLTRTVRLESLDLASLLKVSQTILEESSLEQLLARTLKVIAESAGAQRGMLATRDGDQELVVRARLEVNADVDLEGVPLSQAIPAATSIIRYVARSGNAFGLRDAAADAGTFANDPHLTSRDVRSVLCLPLQSQHRMLGVLYLENNLAADALSRERLPVLQALVSHAATALDKATLNEDLRREVAVRQQAEEDLRFDRARFARVLEMAGEGILSVDADQTIILFNKCAEDIFGFEAREVIGQPLGTLLPERIRAHHHRLVDDMARSSDSARTRPRLEAIGLRKGGEEFPVEVSISQLNLDGKPILTAVVRDISEAKMVEDHRRLLMRELDHRVKNNLAGILGLMRLSAQPSRGMSDFMERFEARVLAMCRAHEMLARDAWQGIELGAIVDGTLAPFASGGRVEVEGPEVKLPATMAQPLSMALHELSVNAAKHGSLSSARGRVIVRWTAPDRGGTTLDWHELDGPRVGTAEPGTGMRIVTGLVQNELGGQAECTRAEDGIRWQLWLPLPNAS